MLTYLGERQKEAIEDLSKELKVAAILPCDVTKDEELAALTESLARARPPASRSDAQPGVRQSGRPHAAVPRNSAQRLPAGAGRQRLFAGGRGPRRRAADDGRRLACSR